MLRNQIKEKIYKLEKERIIERTDEPTFLKLFQTLLNPLGIQLDPSRSKMRVTLDIARVIYRTDGLRGFYRGYIASLCTYVPNSALWWAFYHFYQGNSYNLLILNVCIKVTLDITNNPLNINDDLFQVL